MRCRSFAPILTGILLPFALAAAAQQTLPPRPAAVPARNAQSAAKRPTVPPRPGSSSKTPPARTQQTPGQQASIPQRSQTASNAQMPGSNGAPNAAAATAPCTQNPNSAKQQAIGSGLSHLRGKLGSYGSSVPLSVSKPCPAGSTPSTTSGSGSRAPLNLAGDGIGSFPGCCGYNLTAYSCFRNGGQVMCDFDVTNAGNAAANATSIYNDMRIVGSAGRVFPRTSAFFVDTDGSPFQVSQITPGSKVRFVMEFQGVPDSYTTVTLAQGNTVVQNVQITASENTQTAASK